MAQALTDLWYPWEDIRVYAFDPGAVATGVAFMTLEDDPAEGFNWGATQVKDPRDAIAWLPIGRNDVVLIEDYSHGGTFTKEAKATLEIVGFLKYTLSKPILRHQLKRLSGQSEAATLMEGTVSDLKKDPEKKDAFSALAHCVTYRRDDYHGSRAR